MARLMALLRLAAVRWAPVRARLAAAANAVRDGAELIVANPDRTHPGKDRAVVPETGALLSAVLACTGEVPYRVIGKPEPPMFWKALSLLGAEGAGAVMIGDNVETDGRGALRTGMTFIHIDEWVARQDPPAPQLHNAAVGG